MRGDKQWFDDCVNQAELKQQFEHVMFDMGLDVHKDAGFSAWFHFNSCARFAYKPVWMRETFNDYGGYAAYLEYLGPECCCEIKTPCPIHGLETVWD